MARKHFFACRFGTINIPSLDPESFGSLLATHSIRFFDGEYASYSICMFESQTKLNDCTKPEYYFGSVLKWIQSNRKFISNNLEELFASYSAYFKFAAYLIFLTCEKVEADLNFITEDDVFLHLIDEILSYDNDFLNLLPELVNCKRPIDILSNNEEHVDRWIKIEFVSAAQT